MERRRGVPLMTALNKFEIDPKSRCWLWTGYVHPTGYGQIIIEKKSLRVHRVIAGIYFGMNLDSEFLVLHRCNVRRCINPAHLKLGTVEENHRDSVAAKTHSWLTVNRRKRKCLILPIKSL